MGKIVNKILKEAFGDEEEEFIDGFNDADEFDADENDEDELLGHKTTPKAVQNTTKTETEKSIEPEVEKVKAASNVIISGYPMQWRQYTKDGEKVSYKPVTFTNLKTGKKNITYNLRKGDRTEGQNFELLNRLDQIIIQAVRGCNMKIDKIVIKGVSTKFYKGQNGGRIWLYPTENTQIIVLDGKKQTIANKFDI